MNRKSRALPPSPFRRFNSSPDVIRLVVLMYVRFPLSLRNVEDLLFERGIDICHQTVRLWWNRFGPLFAGDIRRQRVSRMRGFRHWRWHLDEMYVKLNGEMVYANVGVTQNAPSIIIDAGLTPGTAYSYQVLVTDSTAASATSAATAFSPPLPSAVVTSSPASALLAQGGALTIAVSVAPIGGYSGTLTLSCTGLPSWVTATFNPPTVPGGNGVSTLTLSAAGNATTGTSEISVQGSDGTVTVSAPVLLQVGPPTGAIYPAVGDVQAADLVTISRNGTTEQVPASVLKTFLAN